MGHPAKTPPPHTLVLDTSVLWHEDKAEVVAPEFVEFLHEHTAKMDLRVLLPDPVRAELLFQQTTSALKALKRADEELGRVGSITGKTYSHRVTDARVRREVLDRMDSWINSNGIEVAPTPFEDIDWPAIADAAIWRKPPFSFDPKNPEIEKGFRDSLILETVCASCHAHSDRDFAFVCADHLLREAAETRLSEIRYFQTYGSLRDFSSYIRLTEEDLREGFVRSIRGKARKKFYLPGDPNCLWIRESLFDRLTEQFKTEMTPGDPPDVFSSLMNLTRWDPINEGRYQITATRFNCLEDPRDFHWITELRFARRFRRNKDFEPTELFDFDRKLDLTIEVHWHSEVRSNGAFYDPKLDRLELKDRSFEAVFSDDDIST